MSDPQDWQDPPWFPGPNEDAYDWRRYVVAEVQAAWLSLNDDEKLEIAVACQRLGELQRRIVG